MMDAEQDKVLSRLEALLNKDKANTLPEVVIPLLTEVYTPATSEIHAEVQHPKVDNLLEELLPALVVELEEMMKQSIVELRPKTEALLRQHLEQVLAKEKSSS